MPHGPYEWTVFILCALLCAGACAQARHRGLGLRTGALMSALSLCLCKLCARGYAIVVSELPGMGYYGPFFALEPYSYAFGGGVLGFLLALWLTALLSRREVREVGDAFAPVGLWAVALLRAAEALSDFGWGEQTAVGWMQRYPFAIANRYGEWCTAVFNLEALCALGVLAALLLAGKRLGGRRLATALVWWALLQILCESLRTESIQWGFVRVQQLESAVLAASVMLLCGGREKRLWSWLVFALGVGAVIFVEYALDKLPWPIPLDYALMALALAAMGIAVQRRILAAPEGKAAA